MSDPLSSFEDWMRSVERKLNNLERAVGVTSADEILGPGFGPKATSIPSWNDEAALLNGYYFTDYGTPDSPNGGPDPQKQWVGHVVSSPDNEVTVQTVVDPTDPSTSFNRVISYGQVGRSDSGWVQQSPPPPTTSSNVVTGTQADNTGTSITSTVAGTGGSFAEFMGVAVGWDAQASGLQSVAVGDNTQAFAQSGVVIGRNSYARSNYAIAIGDSAVVSGTLPSGSMELDARHSIAIGYDSFSGGPAGVAIGCNAYVDPAAQQGIAIGSSLEDGTADPNSRPLSLNYQSMMLGHGRAGTRNSVVIGWGADDLPNGQPTQAPSDLTTGAANCIVIGVNAQRDTNGDIGIAIGYSSKLGGYAATAVGSWAQATKKDSTAIGDNAQAAGVGSTAIGFYATASTNTAKTNSLAIGATANAQGANSVALGAGASTIYDNVIALGNGSAIVSIASGTLVIGSRQLILGADGSVTSAPYTFS